MFFSATGKRQMYIRGAEMTYGARFVGDTGLVQPPAPKRPPSVQVPPVVGKRFKTGPRWTASAAVVRVVVFGACLSWARSVLAGPSQDDVFKSISNNVNSHSDNGLMLAILAAAAGVVLVAAVWKNWTTTPARVNAPLNHPGKLVRELMKSTGLKHGQLRQLRVLADDLEARGVEVQSPLTLLLCPSLLRKAKETKPLDKADAAKG